jgi:Ca2+-binding RTX toxin-like protein
VGGGAGKDILAGGEGRDQLVGGGGNDRLNARDGTRDTFVSCGGGDRDRAIVDQNDPKPIGCEIVRHG